MLAKIKESLQNKKREVREPFNSMEAAAFEEWKKWGIQIELNSSSKKKEEENDKMKKMLH